MCDVSINKYKVDWNHKVSGPQKKVKDFLKQFWLREVILEEMRIPGTLMRIDLINLTQKIAVEVSPEQHSSYNPFFHGSLAGYRASIKRDMEKENWINLNNFTYVELAGEDLENLSRKLFKEKFGVIL